jgi:hypothetical protein
MRQAQVARAKKFLAMVQAAEDESEDESEDEDEGAVDIKHDPKSGDLELKHKGGGDGADEPDGDEPDGEEDEAEGGRKRMTASERVLSKTLRDVQLSLKETQAELKGMKARSACAKALTEAEIPANVLSVDELMKVPAAERPLWIKHAQKWRLAEESVGGTYPRSTEARESMRESIRSKLAGKGIPVLGAKS